MATVVLVVLCSVLYSYKTIHEPKSKETHSREYSDQEVLAAAYDTFNETEGKFKKLGLSQEPRVYDTLNQAVICAHNMNEVRDKWKDIGKDRGKDGIQENENNMFYEIVTYDTAANGYKDIYRFRVFKCTYVSDLNYQRVDDYWKPELNEINYGVIVFRPLTPEKIKELIDYLWIQDNYNLEGAGILDSYYAEDSNSISYYLYDTTKSGGDLGFNDEVYLYENIYRVDKKSGVIKYSGKFIRTIKGKCPTCPGEYGT